MVAIHIQSSSASNALGGVINRRVKTQETSFTIFTRYSTILLFSQHSFKYQNNHINAMGKRRSSFVASDNSGDERPAKVSKSAKASSKGDVEVDADGNPFWEVRDV